MSYPRYSIHRQSRGRYAICDCGHMDCTVTAYVEPADRAYRYDAPCAQEGHSRPVEVPLEEAEADTEPGMEADWHHCALCDQWQPQEPRDDPDRCPYHARPERERQITAAINIGLILETVGVAGDIALHQGFVLVENFMQDTQPVVDDQLVVLQQAYLDACQSAYEEV